MIFPSWFLDGRKGLFPFRTAGKGTNEAFHETVFEPFLCLIVFPRDELCKHRILFYKQYRGIYGLYV